MPTTYHQVFISRLPVLFSLMILVFGVSFIAAWQQSSLPAAQTNNQTTLQTTKPAVSKPLESSVTAAVPVTPDSVTTTTTTAPATDSNPIASNPSSPTSSPPNTDQTSSSAPVVAPSDDATTTDQTPACDSCHHKLSLKLQHVACALHCAE